ncbi:hypothetical protein [Oscillatoria acuminata]|uniref:hypothetical protein n=1 Tax=Oscillatoria acuminata TaxID=118323 RepID=UPI0003077E47|nr:hypothetical protein [Oscillatoria acuminata]
MRSLCAGDRILRILAASKSNYIMKRQRKGTVGIESNRGWLRLRLPRTASPTGKQQYIYLNLPDNGNSRDIAREKAIEIELDIRRGTLKEINHYLPQVFPHPPVHQG